jgi:hypothetical protein
LAAWVRPGDKNDYVKLKADKITTVYVDPRAGDAKAECDDIRGHGLTPGIYYDPHWFGPTMLDQVKQVSRFVQVDQILHAGEPVMLDIEEEPFDWTATFIRMYREFLPSRPTSVTVGPGQDSSVVPVATLVRYGMHLYMQLYHGDMSPAPAAEVWPACDDLEAKGLPRDMLHPFYDGAAVPWDYRDGCVFVEERLP